MAALPLAASAQPPAPIGCRASTSLPRPLLTPRHRPWSAPEVGSAQNTRLAVGRQCLEHEVGSGTAVLRTRGWQCLEHRVGSAPNTGIAVGWQYPEHGGGSAQNMGMAVLITRG